MVESKHRMFSIIHVVCGVGGGARGGGPSPLNEPRIAQLVERETVAVAIDISRSLVRLRLRGSFCGRGKKNSKAGNRTRVSCVTGRNTNHYTTSEYFLGVRVV